MNKSVEPFKKRYTLHERMEKSKKQMTQNPGKIVIIVEKHPKSGLPPLNNPRFICEKDYKFSLIKNMLEKRIREASKSLERDKQSLFVSMNGVYPNPCKLHIIIENTMA